MDNITQSDIKACLNKSPEEIVDFFKAKGCRITWDWQDDWQECQAKSFTVAKVMEMDILQDIKNELVRALDSGETLQTFKKNLESVLATKGWWKGKKEVTNPDTGDTAEIELGSNRRMRQIFETNLTTSYRAGQYKQQWESRESRPWWMYVCKMLPTSREEHKALHGKVFRYDDPFWDSFYPPNGFNCRCDVIPLTEDEINKIEHYTLQPKLDKDGQPVVVNGIPQYERVLTKIEKCKSTPTTLTQRNAQVTIDNRKMTYKQAFYQDGTMMNAVSTDRGWNYNPGKAVYFEPDLSKYDDIFVKKYLEMKKEFDERLFNTVQNKMSLIKTVVTKEIQKEVAHKIKDYV
ncbi:MAG: minor capsid protein, partial [Spirochaetales bacterium]|nr:minor capsid protein [Spirochaetales bacterium]